MRCVARTFLRSRVITGDGFVPVTGHDVQAAKKLACGDAVDKRVETTLDRSKGIRMPAQINLEAADIKVRPRSESAGMEHGLYGVHGEIQAGELNGGATDIDREWMVTAFDAAYDGEKTLREVERMLDNGCCLFAAHRCGHSGTSCHDTSCQARECH